ncbi:hypothetical protein DCS32_10990 [Dokdonia sp. Dokd-P16]|nr:hypothetical protein DCS32_10990 [Dokdonia sp. Dokd-P16]
MQQITKISLFIVHAKIFLQSLFLVAIYAAIDLKVSVHLYNQLKKQLITYLFSDIKIFKEPSMI